MALAKYDQTWLILLPYDIQRIIFHEYTELVAREEYDNIIDQIPSQLSNDLQPDTMFVHEPTPIPPSMYEKLMQEIYTKIEADAAASTSQTPLQPLIYDIIIDYLNIMILITLTHDTPPHPPPPQPPVDIEYKNMYELYEIRNTLHISSPKNSPRHFIPTHPTNILRRLDYRQLLYFKSICKYIILTQEDLHHQCNSTWWKNLNNASLNTSRIIYDPIKRTVFYWIKGWGNLPYTTTSNSPLYHNYTYHNYT